MALDWSHLHFGGHASKKGRVELAHSRDLGFDLLTALAIGDQDGSTLAPLCLQMRAAGGTYSTRADAPRKTASQLDALAPVMAHVESLELGKPTVFIIDREADSVGHYRDWDAAGREFLVRADDQRRVQSAQREQRLDQVADGLRRGHGLQLARLVRFKNQPAEQFVGETPVVLHRPARTHRLDRRSGKKRHRNVPGPPLPLRLIVSEVRTERGRVARWLLLTNLPASVPAETVALWYYWRWRIESYHKLLKGVGQQVESWLQETPEALFRRLLVAAMSAVVVWRLARDDSPQAAAMRDTLVRLSGRQMKTGRAFTEPALLAGLGVLVAMLDYLREHSLSDLRRLARTALGGLLDPPSPDGPAGDDG